MTNPIEDMLQFIAIDYNTIWNFPGRALDGKYVNI